MISNKEINPETVLSAYETACSMMIENINCYCSNPDSDFTRKRKITVKNILDFLLALGSKATRSEICEFFTDDDPPTDAAMLLQRSKLNNEAVRRVLDLFSKQFTAENNFMGYQILACDGSDVTIPTDLSDTETLINAGEKYINQYHLNALYDTLNHLYVDMIINGKAKAGEANALLDMVKYGQYDHEHSIITADRNFISYNEIDQLNKMNQKFAIRAKDIGSNGILSGKGLPDEEFDKQLTIRLVFRQTNEWKEKIKSEPFTVFCPTNSYLASKDPLMDFYDVSFRVCRFKITDDTYECIITNLCEDEMSLCDIRNLYKKRWKIEISFRFLKYAIGLNAFHSKKRNLLKQEIYARLLIFNMSSLLTGCGKVEEWIDNKNKRKTARKKGGKKKYDYKADITTAITNIRLWLRGTIDSDKLIERIKKYLTQIKPDKKASRENLTRKQRAKSAHYRPA
jgi:hypothetical protein